MPRCKILLVGGGQIGGMLALMVGLRKLGDVFIYDVAGDIAEAKALDLNHLRAIESCACEFVGSKDPSIFQDADVVIITAGITRKVGMSRDDLLLINGNIIRGIGNQIRKHCPNAFAICLTNPLDVMVHLLYEESGLAPHRVVGMAGTLDESRFSYLLSRVLNISPCSIQTSVFGSHGDSMVFLLRFTSINGIPLSEFIKAKSLTEEQLRAIVEEARYEGQHIVELSKNGSAFFAPAASTIQIIESYIQDKKKVISCCVYLNGEYGAADVFAGVPVVIGAKGVERIIELELNKEESEAFSISVEHVKSLRECYRNNDKIFQQKLY